MMLDNQFCNSSSVMGLPAKSNHSFMARNSIRLSHSNAVERIPVKVL